MPTTTKARAVSAWGLAIILMLLLAAGPAWATPYFSAQTDQACSFCHVNPDGGDTLTPQGYAFKANGFYLDKDKLPTAWREWLLFAAGFVHIVTAIIWFGAIFYIHLFIKPRALIRGVPKGERILGLGSMILLAISGGVLAWYRVPSWEVLFHTTFGVVLVVKVSVFLVMVAVGILVNTWLHKKLKREAAEAGQNLMAKYDGQQGRPAYVAVDGQLYDVGGSKLWPGGEHMKRHHAGDDLSQDLESAPHGPEVLERLPALGQAPAAKDPEHLGPTARLLYFLAYFVLACMAVILLCLAWWNWGPPLAHAYQPFKPAVAQACLGCHLKTTPAIVQDWMGGQHAKAKVSCLHCHQAQPGDKDLDRAHGKFYVNHQAPWQGFKHGAAVSAIITPKDCSRCHPGQVKQFAKSKHAGTLEIIWRIDPWLNQGLTSQVERATGCYQCHGSVLKLDSSGRPDPLTWPNLGVGRVNPDGSQGSCSSCHGRHRFSLAQARKPSACGLCHLGPNHPQMEIYAESKHGAIYRSQGEKWNWQAAPEVWTAGVDYRAPTCAVCHMSGGGGTTATHDVSERLSWELQAPETIRPSSFQPWPSKANWWQARAKMQGICRQCHSQAWVSSHYFQLDEAVAEYNNLYYKPVRQKLDQLHHEGLLPKDAFFTSPLWVEYYELWSREGRSARMGAAMMAPDYSWWHGFYECKLRYASFMRRAGQLLAKAEKGYVSPKFPGASGKRNPPAAISKRPRY